MQVVEAQGHLLRPAQDLPKVDDMLLQVVEETAVDHILRDDSVVGRDYAGSVELDNVSVAESGEHLRLLGRGREQWEGQGAVGGAHKGEHIVDSSEHAASHSNQWSFLCDTPSHP